VLYERCNLYLLAGAWLKKRTGIRMLLETIAPLARERAAFGGLAFRCSRAGWSNMSGAVADFALPVTNVLAQEIRAAGVQPENLVVHPERYRSDALRHSRPDNETAKAALGLSASWCWLHGFMRELAWPSGVLDWDGRDGVPKHIHLLLVGDGPALPAGKHKRRGSILRIASPSQGS